MLFVFCFVIDFNFSLVQLAIGRGVAQAKREGNPEWNEWKRVYQRFHSMEKGWRKEPKEARIQLKIPTGCLWVDSRKIYTCQANVYVYDADTGKNLPVSDNIKKY